MGIGRAGPRAWGKGRAEICSAYSPLIVRRIGLTISAYECASAFRTGHFGLEAALQGTIE
jgi:hypothetical protein